MDESVDCMMEKVIENKEVTKKPNIRKDKTNIIVLLLFYTLQGVPMGFSLSIPLFLQNIHNLPFIEQAKFSIVVWPYSMKLLWAPIIDSIFLRKIGRRKSWLIPVQYLLGFSFLILGFNINYWLVKTNKPHIYMLILMVFFTNFLAATQDIVVDGWALSMLKKENIGYVSMCNSAGQAFGIFLGYVLLIMLESESFCNNWLRLHPTSGGLITFQGYLYFWGCIFIMVTTLIAVLKSEKDNLHKLSCNNYYSMIETYKLLINIMRLPSIRMFALILITIKISFSSVDAAFNLKLINEGVSKDDLAAIELLLMPIRIILPFILTKFTSASKPLENYLISMLFRLVVGAASTAVIYITPYFLSQNENYTLIYKIILFTVYFLHELIVCVMIVNIMAFYARISDPKIGGTNMTLLSTIGNLGTSWSKTCAIWLIDFFTYKQCSNDDSNKCFYRYDTNICTKSGGTCRISVDGFYIEALICTIYGILWFFFFRKPIKKLQSKPINEWLSFNTIMSNNVQTHVEDSNLSKPNLKGDWNNIFLLILLYTLQGVELGFLLAMPIILQNQKNTTYEDQALFSISNWPFSMKLMWAPIVDSLYIQRFGRRKSWLLPVQTLLGTILLFSAYNINDWIYKDDRVHICILSATFFLTNLLAATQDVAVDGWALTLLKKENVGYASTCNSSGHSIGGFFGFVLTVLLNSERFCNSYLRSTPMKGGIVSLDSILYFWGFAFIIVTSLIGLLKRENSSLSAKDDTARLNVYQTYKMLLNIIKLPDIITLVFALLMFEIGFTATDNVTTLKLLDAGLPTEDLMMITLAFYPAKILIPVIVSKYTSGPKPMSALLNVYPFRLSSGILCGLLVYVTSKLIGKDENGIYEKSIIYYAFLIVTIFIKELLAYYIFVATMGFFAKISDPRFGGTYMTMLNTVSNIGASWTATASLCMVDWLTFKSCSSDSKNNCSTEDLTKACRTSGGNCSIELDGYYLELVICLVLGTMWYLYYNKKLRNLQIKGCDYWLVNTDKFHSNELN